MQLITFWNRLLNRNCNIFDVTLETDIHKRDQRWPWNLYDNLWILGTWTVVWKNILQGSHNVGHWIEFMNGGHDTPCECIQCSVHWMHSHWVTWPPLLNFTHVFHRAKKWYWQTFHKKNAPSNTPHPIKDTDFSICIFNLV